MKTTAPQISYFVLCTKTAHINLFTILTIVTIFGYTDRNWKRMTSELEGVSDVSVMAAENPGPSDLVEITFQKDPNRKYKFLEAEPKILGVTEITLTFFYLSSRIASLASMETIVALSLSCVSIIAGSLAIAAQKLRLPILKACLGMQIVTCVFYSLMLYITTFIYRLNPGKYVCWNNDYNNTIDDICTPLMSGFNYLESIDQLIESVQTAVSITLAVYCCKVIQCCCPASHVPVIVLKSPTTE